MTTHGCSSKGKEHPLYRVWNTMKMRCQNPNSVRWAYYGARGIRVCEEWQKFKPFFDWALGTGWVRGLELDRIDNEGNYEPSNCRFVTHAENMRNTRSQARRSLPIGVYKNGAKGFMACIHASKGKRIYLGTFDTPEKARSAREVHLKVLTETGK